MGERQHNSALYNALVLSAYFGFIILVFDFFLLIIHKADITDPNNFWLNIKYLIWAIGVYYGLKWYQSKKGDPSYFNYIAFAFLLATFISLFDIFFYLLYTQVINPEIKNIMIEQLIEANKEILRQSQGMNDNFRQTLNSAFGVIFSISLWFSYIFIFLFYSVFFALFIKLTQKK